VTRRREEDRVEDGFVDLEGQRVHVRRRPGRGPLVVLSSALGAVCTDWDPVVALLPGVDVVAYDRPGIGHSAPLEPLWPRGAPATLEDEVARVAALGPALGVPPPYLLVGHSSGGLVAQAFARLHPCETAGLVLVDASTAQPLPPRALSALRHALRARLAGTPLPQWIGPGARRMLVWAETVAGDDPMDAAERRRLYGSAEGARGVMAELDGFDAAAADLAELERRCPLPPIPVSVLTAARSGRPLRRRQPSWLREQDQLARSLRTVFRPVDDSAHLMPFDRPDAVAEEVRRVHRAGQDGRAAERDRPPTGRE
jgi:pimeloyl-ACP methyl ester carboxylesterase